MAERDLEDELLGIERPTPEEEDEAQRLIRRETEFRRAYLITLMENKEFRGWLMEWLNSIGTFEQAFAGSPTGFPDPLATQYSMGMKAAGWNLWCFFDDLAPDLASLMRRGE